MVAENSVGAITGQIQLQSDGSYIETDYTSGGAVARQTITSADGSSVSTTGYNTDGSVAYTDSIAFDGDEASSETINGSGDNVYISYASVSLAAGSLASVTGDLNILTLASNSSATLTGTGNAVTATDSTLNLDGSGTSATVTGGTSTDQINSTASGQTLDLNGASTGGSAASGGPGDPSFSVSGNGVTINAGQYNSISLNGANNELNLSLYDYALINTGTGNVINNDVSGDAVNLESNTSTTITGTGGYFGVVGTGIDVTASSESVDTINNVSFDLTGNSNTMTVGTGSGITLAGTGNAVTTTDSTLNLDGSGTSATVTGGTSTDQINLTTAGQTLDLNGGSTGGSAVSGGSGDRSFNVTASGDTISDGQYDTAQVNGNGNTLNLNGYDYVLVNSGAGNVIGNDVSGDAINLGSNTSTTITGTGGYFGIVGTGINVAASSESVDTFNNVSFDLTGNSNTMTVGTYSNITLAGAGNAVATTGSTVNLDGAGTSASVSGDSAVNLTASNQTITAADGNIYVGAGLTGETINASDETIYEGSNDDVDIVGTDDVFDGNSSDTTDYNGTTSTGSGGGDGGGDGDGGDGGDGDGDGGSSGGGSSGVAAGVARAMNVIAQYDVSHGFKAAATTADAAWSRTNHAIAAAAQATGTQPSPFNGIQWAPGSVITWSFASPSDTGANPVSDAVQAQYQAIIEQALQTWSAATGVTFQQVANSSAADFQIGWGDFETNVSGTVGYTSYAGISGGQAQSLLVRLEDPSEDPLIAGADGALTYAGTQTTLLQTALHEIGHVLGISETSDPNSVMYPLLGPSNTTLDSTDVNDVDALYKTTTPSSGGAYSTALMIQTMAAFGAPAAASSAFSSVAASQSLSAQLAPPLHHQ